jgi:glycosyltransferase involved in cell wall biosynthesis
MRISIITVTFNSASTIRDTIESVHSQVNVEKEHIIIDGCSTDETLGIVRGYPHITKCISEPDQGIYHAMNKGIALASGDVIGILNSDDVYPGNHILEKVAKTFKSSQTDALYGDLVYVDSEDTDRVVRAWKSGKYEHGDFKWGWMPPHPTFFVKRELYEKYGGFNVDMGTAADYELMLRLIHHYGANLTYIPEILVKMRSGGASNESILARLRANRNDKKAWGVNGLKPYWFTLYLKPLRKITQFLYK